jgi:hypothetical protein
MIMKKILLSEIDLSKIDMKLNTYTLQCSKCKAKMYCSFIFSDYNKNYCNYCARRTVTEEDYNDDGESELYLINIVPRISGYILNPQSRNYRLYIQNH